MQRRPPTHPRVASPRGSQGCEHVRMPVGFFSLPQDSSEKQVPPGPQSRSVLQYFLQTLGPHVSFEHCDPDTQSVAATHASPGVLVPAAIHTDLELLPEHDTAQVEAGPHPVAATGIHIISPASPPPSPPPSFPPSPAPPSPGGRTPLATTTVAYAMRPEAI